MKTKYLYLLFLIPALQGCEANNQSGQIEAGWLFWVFLGLLLGGLFIGALTNFLRKKKPEDAPTKAEQEIEAYEETLQHKLQKETHSEEQKEKEDKEKKDQTS